MPFDINELTENQLDALKEVGNIGAGHGATALSQLVGKRILITVPKASVIPLKNVPQLVGNPNTLVAGLFLTILGDATGKILLLFPRDSAVNLADMLLKQPMGTSKILSEMGHSAIKEAGNILTGAYLSALNEFLGMLLLISVPTLVFAAYTAITLTFSYSHGDRVGYLQKLSKKGWICPTWEASCTPPRRPPPACSRSCARSASPPDCASGS